MPQKKVPCPLCGSLKNFSSRTCMNCAKNIPNKGQFIKGQKRPTIYVKCQTCDTPVSVKSLRGLCEKCNQKYRRDNKLGAFGKLSLICPVCSKEFKSNCEKKFCSRQCYMQSSEFKQRVKNQQEHNTIEIRKRAGWIDPTQKHTAKCLNCGHEYIIARQRYMNSRKCCSRTCSREYFAKRFERFNAEPKNILSPQGYDTFLSEEKLCCLIPGCRWKGKTLSYHMNIAHGIPKDIFKELAGFNHGTGVITTELAKRLSKRRQQWHKENPETWQMLISHLNRPKPIPNPHGLRSEGKEHRRKVLYDNLEWLKKLNDARDKFVHSEEGKNVLRNTMKETALRESKKLREKTCSVCGKIYLAQQRYAHLSRYCSEHCANTDPQKKYEYRTEKAFTVKCSICGKEFITTRNQHHQSLRCRCYCSMTCKQKGKKLWKSSGRKGEENGSAKLTWEIASKIRSEKGITMRKVLALQYGVSEGTIKNIWNNHNWIDSGRKGLEKGHDGHHQQDTAAAD